MFAKGISAYEPVVHLACSQEKHTGHCAVGSGWESSATNFAPKNKNERFRL